MDLFAFKINYDKQPGNSQVQALYNGNISETYWKTNTDLTKRSYGYQYDKLNRLTDAIYRKQGDAIPVSGAYNESLSYDKNGNIKFLQRYGASDAPSITFQTDDLTYGYLNENSNQLAKVTDSPAGNNNEGFKDGNKTGDDFTYDANGNMITDKNKNITQIEYNHLNLPKKITFGTNGTIEYIYNATGQKLEKIVKEVSGTTHTDYLGGFQYNYAVNDGHVPDDPGDTDPPVDHDIDPDPKDPPVEANRFSAMASQAVLSRPTLEFFPTAEGYYDYVGKKYVYQYKDHLGNIRLSYAKNPVTQVLEIIEENNYYPFGLKHKGYNDYTESNSKYKYNGKEFQDEMGLGMYDYGARNYDPALGRWMNIDPLGEKYFGATPYNYVLNSPVNSIDPDGMDVYLLTSSGQTILALKQKDKTTDTVYAVTESKSNSITSLGEEKPLTVWDMKDTNGDGKLNDKDGRTVRSGLIGQMTSKRSGSEKNYEGGYYSSIGEQSDGNERDYKDLFKYASDNTHAEFGLTFFSNRGKNYIQLSSFGDIGETPSPYSLGIKDPNKNVSRHYHSHPDINKGMESENYSMGGDYEHTKTDTRTYNNYIYFPGTSRLYKLTLGGTEYIKQINSSKDLN